MILRLLRFTLTRGLEIVVAIILVLAFFLAFMGFLSFIVPEGTSLTDLMRSGNLPGGAGGRGKTFERRLDTGSSGDAEPSTMAVLSRIERDVKDKPADAIAWNDSRPGLPLRNYHSVQTFERSRATITFSGTGEMILDENTLVILKKAERSALDGRKRASLLILDGALRGRIAIGRGEGVAVEVEAATETALLRSVASPGERTEFAVSVNEDKTSTFTVYAGTAEVISPQGTIAVAPNQAVTVDVRGATGPLLTLPPAPDPNEPAQGSRLRYRSTRTRVLFSWSATEGSDAYILAVARDPAFMDLVLGERVTTPAFNLGNLKDGAYYWRVRSVKGPLESADSTTREFRLVKTRRPPDLRVNFPAASVDSGEIAVMGDTEPGTRVFIGGEEVEVGNSGKFAHTLKLKRGVNVVVVEAVDDAGNVAYRSRIINARY